MTSRRQEQPGQGHSMKLFRRSSSDKFDRRLSEVSSAISRRRLAQVTPISDFLEPREDWQQWGHTLDLPGETPRIPATSNQELNHEAALSEIEKAAEALRHEASSSPAPLRKAALDELTCQRCGGVYSRGSEGQLQCLLCRTPRFDNVSRRPGQRPAA